MTMTMKKRLGVCSLLAFALALGATVFLVTACPDTSELVVSADVPFDGSFLGPCTGDAQVKIEAGACPTTCPGLRATAFCTGSTFGECACASTTAPLCDSGCCADPLTGYTPAPCDASVVMPDPSEGLCDGDIGYLVCNNTCFATFVCEIPDGFSALEDAGSKDGGKDAAKDAKLDAPSDAASLDAEAGADGSAEASDGSADAHDGD